MTATFAPTAEQQTALDLFATGKSLAIEAGAGAGKTSTLRLLAEAAPNRRGQYVAFNRAIVSEAGEKMPSHVRCSTAHSLAMRAVGHKFAHRLKSPRMRSTELATRLRLDPIWVTNFADERKQLSPSFLAGLTMRAVGRFCQSAALEPEPSHVPIIEGLDAPRDETRAARSYPTNEEVRRALLPAVKRAWADLSNTGGSLPYRHDHYLKAYQLSNPRIHVDFILFDEAQDANPVMVAIVAAQEHAQLIWVGDSQQQIYSFTGAINALAGVPADQRAFLTQSFRFGPVIADLANVVLEGLDAELRLSGTTSRQSTVGPVEEPDVILTRTNAAAVRAVLTAKRDGQAVHLVGGGTEVLAFARAAQRLMDGQPVDHPDLACFDSWGEVKDYVDHDEQGGELRLMVKLVEDFSVPVILGALDNMIPEGRARLVVSTAHKAKGREWGAVQLADDFPPAPEAEELRLLYVAVTRARERLDVTRVGYFAEDEPDAEDAEPLPLDRLPAVDEPILYADGQAKRFGDMTADELRAALEYAVAGAALQIGG